MIDAPRSRYVSKSILKAQNEQVQFKPYSANAEDLRGGTLNEPANYGSKQTSNFCYPQEQLDFFFSVHVFIIFIFVFHILYSDFLI